MTHNQDSKKTDSSGGLYPDEEFIPDQRDRLAQELPREIMETLVEDAVRTLEQAQAALQRIVVVLRG